MERQSVRIRDQTDGFFKFPILGSFAKSSKNLKGRKDKNHPPPRPLSVLAALEILQVVAFASRSIAFACTVLPMARSRLA